MATKKPPKPAKVVKLKPLVSPGRGPPPPSRAKAKAKDTPPSPSRGRPLDDFGAGLKAFWRGETRDVRERRGLFTPMPNALRWMISADHGNFPSLLEQPRQWQFIRDLFELRCPHCNEGEGDYWELRFSKAELRSALLGEVLLEWSPEAQEDACPRCRTVRSDLVEAGAFAQYSRVHVVLGQRSGKSTVFALIAAYMEYRILCIAHTSPGGLAGTLGLPRQAGFAIAFMAAESVQSKDTIWAAYLAFRRESPWFERYREWVQAEEENQPRGPGVKLWTYKETDFGIENDHPKVHLVIATVSTNSASNRGRTRLWCFIDEISHMQQTDSTRSARENYRVMKNSLRTVLSRVKAYGAWPWIGLLASATSPQFRGDRGMELLDEAQRDPHLYIVHAATWDWNVAEPYANFALDLALDPVGINRDFGAQPPGAAYPLIHDEIRFAALVTEVALGPMLTFGERRFKDELGHLYVAPFVKDVHMVRSEKPRYLAFDAGITHDAFTGTCFYGEPMLDEKGKLLDVEVFQDWMFRLVPGVREEIWFDAILDIIAATAMRVPIAGVAFDHWQSKQLIQQTRVRFGVYAEEETTLDDDFEAFVRASLTGRVHLLRPDAGDFGAKLERLKHPRDLSAPGAVLYEATNLEQDPTTRRVSNPRKGQERGASSDDAARVVVHGRRMAAYAGFVARQDDRSARAKRSRAGGALESWSDRGGLARSRGGAGAPPMGGGGGVTAPGRMAGGGSSGGGGLGTFGGGAPGRMPLTTFGGRSPGRGW